MHDSPLKATRLANGLTLRTVASHTGITAGYLSDLENRKKSDPSLRVARTLARFYAVSVDELFPPDSDLGVTYIAKRISPHWRRWRIYDTYGEDLGVVAMTVDRQWAELRHWKAVAGLPLSALLIEYGFEGSIIVEDVPL